MRTTLTLDDDVVLLLRNEMRRTGESLKQVVNRCLRAALTSPPVFVTEAVEEKMAAATQKERKPWAGLAGGLKHLRKETARINRVLKREFEQIEPED